MSNSPRNPGRCVFFSKGCTLPTDIRPHACVEFRCTKVPSHPRLYRLAKKLDAAGLAATSIHGNKTQGARTRALSQFKSGRIRVLVATDIAARGLDISQLPHVVNYELPNVAEDYIHRIGRTGRAGNEGEAMSLVCVDELGLLKDIERLIKREIPRNVVAGFEPDPSIKAAPLAKGGSKGRSKQQASTGAAGRKQTSGRNKQRPPFKAKTTSKGGSKKRSSNRRSSPGGSSQPRARHNTRQAA